MNEPKKQCRKCEGQGFVMIEMDKRSYSDPPEYGTVTCQECNGKGWA